MKPVPILQEIPMLKMEEIDLKSTIRREKKLEKVIQALKDTTAKNLEISVYEYSIINHTKLIYKLSAVGKNLHY